MSPHPLSGLRKGASMENTIGMKDLWQLRRGGNFVLQNSTSQTHRTEAAAPEAVEYKSFQTLINTKRKHTRSEVEPKEKYLERAVSSSAIGWYHESEHGKVINRY